MKFRTLLVLMMFPGIPSLVGATVEQPKSLFSSGGARLAGGIHEVNANLGDVFTGVSWDLTTEVQHGFWTTPKGQVVGVEGPRVTFIHFLAPAQPNPSRNITSIEYGLPAESEVSLNVYDVSGRLVRQLVNGNLNAGVFRQSWNLRTDTGVRVRSGMYFFRLSTRTFTAVRKVVVLE